MKKALYIFICMNTHTYTLLRICAVCVINLCVIVIFVYLCVSNLCATVIFVYLCRRNLCVTMVFV